ncbi:MAG: hypothetical protein WC223_06680 [Bacteroidales bacterium]|jgi:outer membrane protein OmpA-like peptidoglycan-associated protein
MRKMNLKSLAAMIVVALIVASCGLGKMVKKYPTVKYEVTPEVLETNGGKISVTVNGTIPPKYFHKKAIVDFTPVIKYDGGEVALKTLTLQGEKAKGDGTVIKYTDGGSFSYTDIVAYKPEMNKSELRVNAKAKLKKEVPLGDRKLADGVIYTSERINEDYISNAADHKFQKEELVTNTANLYFPFAESKIDMKLPNNKKKENADLLNALKEFSVNGWKKKGIEINAWASPEGEINFNQNLSADRAKAAQNMLKKYIDEETNKIAKAKDKKAKPIKDSTQYDVKANGEDWKGFVAELDKSTFKDKSVILNVINAQNDVTKRQQEINKMVVVYKEVEDDILPGLRRAEIKVNSLKPSRTDEQIAALSTTKPDSLKLEELLYAATLTNDANIKLKIYKSATTVYPQDWRGYNNAAYIDIKSNNLDEATTLLEKANTLSPNNGMVLNNQGVIAAMKKDYDNAKTLFETAQQNGQNAGYNIGIINLRKGDYAGALASFSGITCNYNLALAQLLSKDNASATTTIDCIKEKTAYSYYLMAVVGARTNNVGMLTEGLTKAVQLDGKYKAQAKDDREFLKFFSNSQFQDAVK